MSTILDQIGDAILTALNTDRPSGVPEALEALGDELDPPTSLVMYLLADEVSPMTGNIGREGQQLRPPPGPVVKRRASFVLEARRAIQDGSAPRKATSAMLAWVIACLGASRLGGLAHDVDEIRTDYLIAQRDVMYVRAQLQLAVDYSTRRDDLTLK